MKKIIAYFAMVMALTACGSDDEILNNVQRGDRHPLQFTATVEDIQTRVTSDNKWEDGDIIGVKISTDPNNTIGQYALNADGTVKEVIKGVEWQGTGTADITAWYPFGKIENMEIADQSEGLKGMNLLKAELKDQTYEEGKTLQLVFRHQMARMRCRLVAAEGSGMTEAELAENATVEFVGQTYLTFENGEVKDETSSHLIKPYKTTENGKTTYTALLVPRADKSGTELIRVTVGNKVFHYRPANDIKLEAGKSYNYNIKIADVPDYTTTNGTYHVYTAEGLKAWAAAVAGNNSTSCTLEENITMSGYWTPISSFTGTFDGNGHTISGLTVNETDLNNASFIGSLNGGTVKNLTLENVNITGNILSTGGVAGDCYGGTIENCHITGTGTISVTENSRSSNIGGIVGHNREGTILACHVSKECSVGTTVTDLVTDIYVGGIAGTNYGGTIKGCYALCSLSGPNVGGICGVSSSSDGTESSYIACYSNFSYNAINNAGGILGRSSGNPTFKECYWAANILNGVGDSDSDPAGITKVTDWSSAVATKMNTALGADFGYEYVFNTDDSNEPLKLVKKQ